MKKIFLNSFMIFIILLITGCSVSNSDYNHSSDTENSINMHYNKVENFDCQFLNDKTVAINGKYFVNSNNDVYEYSLSKVFHDSGTNCSQVDTKNKVIVGVNSNGVYDGDYYLYMENNDFEKNMKHDHERAREYFLKKSFPNSSLQLWLITNYGVILENNQLFYVSFDFDGGYSLKSQIEIDLSDDIIGIYKNSWELFHVETTTSYYDCAFEVINKEEIEKHADAECKEKFICTKVLDFNHDDVKKYLGDIVILNNGDIYKYNRQYNHSGSSYHCSK
ncbi:MAG: hypothetical protein E7313_07615 [Clostridiales bacterium]|nr:hypothetical protein [Clostridiales bacterium]